MTTPSAEYTEYILDLLGHIGPVRTSRFFGGTGLSNGFAQFAMIKGISLYFVTSENSRDKYMQAGMQPFSYTTKKGHVQVRRYFELPEDILADPEQLRLRANEAMQIAGKPTPTRRTNESRQKTAAPLNSAM